MDWISKLEKKMGRYAIKNLSLYIVGAYIAGLLISYASPSFYANYLSLDVRMILRGQIWRIVTFIIQPPTTNILFFIFAAYLYYMIGTSLERTWGAFRFNLYYFSGMLFHFIGALIAFGITYLATGTGVSFQMGADYLNLSMFFAFAALFPDVQLLLFFIIPIKIKWLAIIDGAFFLYTIVRGFLPASLLGISAYQHFYNMNYAIAAVVSLLNFLIFFLTSKSMRRFSPKQVKRKRQYQKQVNRQSAKTYPDGARHRCEVCGRTDITNPELEFRYCSKCDGAHEYCQDHLFSHQHIHH